MVLSFSLIIGSYLLGSISPAYILTRWKKGIDIRLVGSGNAGAVNVGRIIGRKYGIGVAIFDVSKGIIPVMIARLLLVPIYMIILIGAAVIVGHNWPVYFHFRGGNGLATLMGILVYSMPKETIITFSVGLSIGLICKRLSFRDVKLPSLEIGAIAGYFLLPFLAYNLNRPISMVVLPLILGPLLVPSRIAFINEKKNLSSYHREDGKV